MNNNLNQPEEKIYKLSEFSQIHQKYLDLITNDLYEYIETEEKIKSDNDVMEKIIKPLQDESNDLWRDCDSIISSACNDFAVDGFINGYLCAKEEQGGKALMDREKSELYERLSDIEECLIKSRFLTNKIADYFSEETFTKKQRDRILFDFSENGTLNLILFDYLKQALNNLKELKNEIKQS